MNEARTLVAAAANALKMWADQHQEELDAWTNRAASEPLAAAENPGEALRGELARVDAALESQRRALHDRDQLSQELQAKRDSLTRLEAALSELREQAGALAEALAELRGHVTDETCPVCDRDFSEVSSRSLRQHLDEKVAAITEEGARLRTLRADRDAALADLRRVESTLQALATEVLPEDVVAHNVIRQRLLAELIAEHEKIRPALQQLGVLRADASRAQREMQEAQALSQDVELVERELGRLAGILGITAQPGSALEASWTELRELASTRLHRAESIAKARDEALELLDRYVQSNEALQQLKNQVAEAAERKQRWEVRSTEGRRRQLLAKAVQEASARARATIVQRVFTESLNEVWRDVFTRLAPREPFVPSFGIPTSSRAALELTLQTVHASGELGGSPQTMLSAGNLNTAALSLFLALHLAVEPVVPCLVFDDPVQSMDEVHIAQFAGLIRVLAKHHGRQVVIAVHERELFEYLRLELSPAFDGDELITIELGSRAEDEDHGITRLEWAPDPAVAS